jgi:hypothetical protein
MIVNENMNSLSLNINSISEIFTISKVLIIAIYLTINSEIYCVESLIIIF